VHPFYLLVTLPAGAILAARGIGALLQWRTLRLGVAVALLALTLLATLNLRRYAEETLVTPGAHGLTALPLRDGLALLRAAIPERAVQSGAVIFAEAEAWILSSLRGTLLNMDAQAAPERALIIPTQGGYYLRFTDAAPDSLLRLSDGSGLEVAFVTQASYALERYTPVPSQQGIAFLHAALPTTAPQPGARFQIATYWRVERLHPERNTWLLGAFVHVYDATERRIAIADGQVVPGATWRQGDVHLIPITVTLPADATLPLTFHVGQFDGVHQINALFTLPDGSGSPVITLQP
jgi:hypothetical protein